MDFVIAISFEIIEKYDPKMAAGSILGFGVRITSIIKLTLT